MGLIKYKYWLSEDGLEQISEWSRMGLTDEQLAANMGISRETISAWRKRFPVLSDTIKGGKNYADAIVENSLYQAAMGGNITAIIFWLKNRQPTKWRDKQTVEFSGNANTVKQLEQILDGMVDETGAGQ